jgi:hypothetical protein
VFPISGDRDLPVGPFTGQVDADAGDDCGLVLQAERGEVEAVGGKSTEETPVSYSSGVGIQDISTSPGTWLKTPKGSGFQTFPREIPDVSQFCYSPELEHRFT